jgi:hypothetical protein
MKPKLLSSCILLLAVAACQQIESAARAAVTFSVNPSAVSNFYAGLITLQIGGLNTGETVRIDKFLDVNSNGVIGAPDLAVQSFLLTDGQASVFHDGATAVTNINVPGDFNPTNGVITARLRIASDVAQQIVAQYIFRLSSPTSRFTSQTTLFNVTNSAYAQRFTGAAQCRGTNVPNAVVMVGPGNGQNKSPIAGVVANNSGNYTLNLPGGAYSFWLFKSNFVADLSKVPRLTLTNGATFTTNLTFLIPATNSVSGHVVDAANTNTGLADIFMVCQTADRQLMAGACYTGTNGAFTVPVIAGQWQVSMDSGGLGTYGYLGLNDNPQVNTTTGSVSGVTLALPKGTALFYGSVFDNQGHPLAGIDILCQDNNDQYVMDYPTDANGYFVAPMVGGLSNNLWRVEVDNDTAPTNYLFAQPAFNQNGGTNLNAGQALLVNFTSVLATNRISGYLKDGSGNAITNVWIWVQATINGGSYQGGVNTDATGHYAINVGNGAWTVGVNCGDGDHNLGSQYLCPDTQTVNIANNNGTANFTALLAPSRISGTVKDSGSTPIANVAVYAYLPAGGDGSAYATTDGSGHYSFNVANGTWNVGLNCCGNNALSQLGYLCVGEQSTTVNNSTNVVNFTVPPAPYQITGHLRDASNNPIANVGVYAGNNFYNACATTDSSGFYRLYVTNGDWYVNLDCNALSSLGYLCPGGLSVTISNATAVADFSTIQAPYQITGWVRNDSNQPFTNLDVHAYATIGTNFYWLDSWTDSGGNYSLPAANGSWTVEVDCGGLGSGYLCPDNATVTVAGASVVTNFTIQWCGVLQILTTSPLPAGQVGSYYDFYLQASSCYPDFYWSLTSGSLPPGLTGDPSTGEIYGTPTNAGTYNFTVQVTDGNSDTTNQVLSLTISPPLQDVQSYFVMKMADFRQLDTANLVPDTNRGPFTASAGLIQSDLDRVPVANIYLPGGEMRGLPRGGSGIELQVLESFASQAAFDAVYTNGNYTFAMATRNNGFQFPVLTLPVAAYPAAQRVSNFAAAQSINPASPFTLQWSNPPDATTNDAIWVYILDGSGNMVFSTPKPPTNHLTYLRGTVTSVGVPTNTFQLGSAYTGILCFFRVTSVNTAAYPGATGTTLVGVVTSFPMAAPSASLPVLSQPARTSGAQFGFLLSGATGQNYTVLASTNAALRLSNWFTVLTTNLSASPAFIQDNHATNTQRFYRVKVGP